MEEGRYGIQKKHKEKGGRRCWTWRGLQYYLRHAASIRGQLDSLDKDLPTFAGVPSIYYTRSTRLVGLLVSLRLLGLHVKCSINRHDAFHLTAAASNLSLPGHSSHVLKFVTLTLHLNRHLVGYYLSNCTILSRSEAYLKRSPYVAILHELLHLFQEYRASLQFHA